jgi:hypothetical protein
MPEPTRRRIPVPRLRCGAAAGARGRLQLVWLELSNGQLLCVVLAAMVLGTAAQLLWPGALPLTPSGTEEVGRAHARVWRSISIAATASPTTSALTFSPGWRLGRALLVPGGAPGSHAWAVSTASPQSTWHGCSML